jgi:hypothetical protein
MRFSLSIVPIYVILAGFIQPTEGFMPLKDHQEATAAAPQINMQDYPLTGPWLVEVEQGKHEEVILEAQKNSKEQCQVSGRGSSTVSN